MIDFTLLLFRYSHLTFVKEWLPMQFKFFQRYFVQKDIIFFVKKSSIPMIKIQMKISLKQVTLQISQSCSFDFLSLSLFRSLFNQDQEKFAFSK